MSTIILPNRWKRQPTGPVDIDWGNPLTAGLKSVVCPSLPQTLITNERIVTVGTGTIEGRQYGKAIVCASGSYGAQVAADGDTLLPSNDSGNECTILVYSRFTDTTNRASSLFGFAGANRVQAHVPYSDGTIYWDYGGTGNRRTTYAGFTKTTNAETYAFQYGVINPYRAIWRNRQLLASGTTVDTAARGATTEPFYVGGAYGQTGDNVEVYLLAVVNHVMSAGEIHAFNENPWQIFKKRAKILYFPSAGGGGATGTLAATESGSDTAALTGDVLIDGALAATESGSDTAALTGDVIVQGALAVTESGTDTAAATGLVLVQGALAATESGSDTAALAGLVLVQGSIASVEPGADTASIAGDVLVSGALAASETGSDTAAFTGDASLGIFGSIDAAESGSDSAQVTGLVLIQGGLAVTETGSDTAAITGPAAVSGSIAATETGSDTAAVTGLVLIYGSLATTETGSDTAAVSSFRPTVPGIEYTLPEGKAHYTLPDGRAHYTIAA